MDYNLVLGMKVKTCVNSPYLNNNGWGKVGSEFPWIYVWIVTRSKELNVTPPTRFFIPIPLQPDDVYN